MWTMSTAERGGGGLFFGRIWYNNIVSILLVILGDVLNLQVFIGCQI